MSAALSSSWDASRRLVGEKMVRWRALPAELHPQVLQLIVQLRALKDRSELRTRQLAAKTGYSARSWHRYLNGLSLPPREAVEAMARIGGVDPVRLLALHETAAQRWAQGHAVVADVPGSSSPPVPEAPVDEQSYRHNARFSHAFVIAGAVALALSISLALLLAVRLADARAELAQARADADARGPATVSESLVPVVYTCRPRQSGDGHWYAGLSRTSSVILAYTHVGPEVAEAQCLLRRAGASPGDIDGVFGPKTQRAVIRVQTREGLVVDGVIGPHTWKVLREADSK
ncbi:peptidoglycan-binding protein [Streptomyces sp. NPDC089424]|uniref:peptidoglycan-binding protein n=1 Tax=Streptomyces sp. NPDC089424 TaxID=3365917 RepID=UPI003824F52F